MSNRDNFGHELVQIRYLADIEPIEAAHAGEWVDLRAAKDIFIPAHTSTMIPLGVAMRLPVGYEAIIAPRSSTFKKYGLIMTNSIGVIDNLYSGNDDEWQFPVYAIDDILIKKNTRLCQFRIQKQQPRIQFEVVSDLEGSNRGGFGSTGD